MGDIKSAVHCLKSFAQDALKQAEHLRKVSLPQVGGSRGLASGEGCKGETPSYTLEIFYMQFLEVDFGWCKGAAPLCFRKLCIWWAKYV